MTLTHRIPPFEVVVILPLNATVHHFVRPKFRFSVIGNCVRISRKFLPSAQRCAPQTTAVSPSRPGGQVREQPRRYERQYRHIANGLFGDHHQLRGADAAPAASASGIHQLVIFHAPIHEAYALRLGSINHLRENHRCECCLSANDLPLHPRVTAAWMQSDLQESRIKSCSAGSDSRSHPRARFMPAPTAAPLTAAIVGSVDRAIRKKPS